MSEYIDKSEAVGEGYLQDWYISSVSADDEPVWTEAHIEKLANDFIVIPKDTPVADVAPVVHGKWIRIDDPEFICGDFECSNCSHREYEVDTDELMPGENHLLYCPFCGAKMDGGGTNGADH